MPLGLLLGLVIGGISAIVVLLHLLGKSARTRLTEDAVRAAWRRHYPEDEVLEVTLSGDGYSALVITGQGPGLLWSFGADTVGRHLRSCDVAERADGLRVTFRDYGFPGTTLRLGAEERAHWVERMKPA